jgi:organic radical activating enzyme
MLSNSSDLVEIRQKYTKYFHINWNLTNKCNFSCSYCHPYNYEGSSPTFDLEVYKEFIVKIINHIDDDRQLVVSFTGGEPTAMPHFEELLEFLVENGVQVGLTTNGSKSIKFWEKYKKHFRWVSFSFHAEKTSLKHCLKVVETLWPHTLLGVRIMMHPKQEYFDKCMEFFEMLQVRPYMGHFFVEKVPVIDDWLTPDEKPHMYTAEQFEKINEKKFFERKSANPQVPLNEFYMPIETSGVFRTKDGRLAEETSLNTNNLYISQKNKFYDWLCYAGVEGLFVNEQGIIHRATCLPDYIDGELACLGDLYDLSDLDLPTEPIVCKKQGCYCNTDIVFSKKKVDNG